MAGIIVTPAEKVRENRLRRTAKRQGLRLRKSRMRDPRGKDYGLWWIYGANLGRAGMTLDEVERYLNGEQP